MPPFKIKATSPGQSWIISMFQAAWVSLLQCAKSLGGIQIWIWILKLDQFKTWADFSETVCVSGTWPKERNVTECFCSDLELDPDPDTGCCFYDFPFCIHSRACWGESKGCAPLSRLSQEIKVATLSSQSSNFPYFFLSPRKGLRFIGAGWLDVSGERGCPAAKLHLINNQQRSGGTGGFLTTRNVVKTLKRPNVCFLPGFASISQ